MHALISLLPTPYSQQVENLWDELESVCGVKGVRGTPFPHFTWTTASELSETAVQTALSKLARQIKPFTIAASGIGIFPGNRPVVFIRLVKSPQLFILHEIILNALQEPFHGTLSPLYQPDVWVPHITLGIEDVTEENLGAVVSTLVNKDFQWEMQIDNLSLISTLADGRFGMKFIHRLQA